MRHDGDRQDVVPGRLSLSGSPRRNRAGRSSAAIWRANRRRAFKDAWRFNLLSLAVVGGCVVGIVFYEGLGELCGRV
jgi:hypothetical protein